MKRRNIFIAGFIVLFLFVGAGLLYFWIYTEKENGIYQSGTEGEVKKKLSVMPDTVFRGESDQGEDEKKFLQYVNEKYAYALAYLKEWEIDTSSAEQDLSEEEFSDGSKVQSGGVVFFSNYKNIGDYTPETKPQDMFLVNVATYAKEGKTMHDIVTGLGFDAYDAKDFPGKNIGGSWFFARTTDENNPMVAVIFEKDGLFYVIQPAFINGNTDVLSGVEEMARSFEVLERK